MAFPGERNTCQKKKELLKEALLLLPFVAVFLLAYGSFSIAGVFSDKILSWYGFSDMITYQSHFSCFYQTTHWVRRCSLVVKLCYTITLFV
ncbi:hypothetical protein Peur_015410 [Populus x canadensis]